MRPAAALAMAAGGSRRVAALASTICYTASSSGRRCPLRGTDPIISVQARSDALLQSGKLQLRGPLAPFAVLPFSTGAGSGGGNHGGEAVHRVTGGPRGFLPQVGVNLQGMTEPDTKVCTFVNPEKSGYRYHVIEALSNSRTDFASASLLRLGEPQPRGLRPLAPFDVLPFSTGAGSGGGNHGGEAAQRNATKSGNSGTAGVPWGLLPQVGVKLQDTTKTNTKVCTVLDPEKRENHVEAEPTGRKVGKRSFAAVDGNDVSHGVKSTGRMNGGLQDQEDLPASGSDSKGMSTDSTLSNVAGGMGVTGCCRGATKEMVAEMFAENSKQLEIYSDRNRMAHITHTVAVLCGVLALLIGFSIVTLLWGVAYIVEKARDVAVSLSADGKTKQGIRNVMDHIFFYFLDLPKRMGNSLWLHVWGSEEERAEKRIKKAKAEKKARLRAEKAKAKAEKKERGKNKVIAEGVNTEQKANAAAEKKSLHGDKVK